MTEEMPEVRFVGYPDGPRKFVPEIGLELDTFTEPAGGKHPALNYHVPLNFRGPFKPEMLANFDAEYDYRVDQYGWALCCAKTQSDTACSRKAMNRYPRCVVHGGRLHPLDKLLTETGELETSEPLTRYQQFIAGQITCDDLDDEELMAFGFRKADGKIFKPKNVPRDMVTAFTAAIFARSLDKLKSSSLEAANTLVSLMSDPSVDANVRLRCATELLDRTLGKAPLVVSLNANAPWETVFESILVTPPNVLDVEEVPQAELTRPSLPPDVKPPEPE